MADTLTSDTATTTIQIGQRRVGPGQSVFVIAEAGVNHNGDESTALKMIDAAVAGGADAIKFQYFSAELLTTDDAPTARYQTQSTGKRSQRAILRELELSHATFDRLANACRVRGIEFIVTPFAASSVVDACRLGLSAVKVASTDLIDHELLTNAAGAHLPLIVSTGAAHQHEIAEAVTLLRHAGVRERLILLHCISAYPARVEQANLGAIQQLANRFGCVTGFSDHTKSTMTSAMAVCAGAHILEKHFTLDRTANGPDHAMSLEPSELAEYIRLARLADEALGIGDVGVSAVEMEVRQASRKRIVAAREIKAGETISKGMLTVKRAATGLEANQLPSVVGRRALQDMLADEPVSLELLL